ncbi:hypothetical protein [Paenibacillus macerans]|uniref:hypothetical protein n=1 Tax=Paenibacillus macerans TaxID=44252 RepID=UPI003D31EE9D
MPEYFPKYVTEIELASGGDMKKLLPKYEEIPEEFKDMNNRTKWNKFISQWFYSGVENLEIERKEGVDPQMALWHIGAILASREPKHEHKMAGCAYLASLWFEEVSFEREARA